MRMTLPFSNSQSGGVNIALTLIFSILLGGLILQQSNVVGFKLAQSQRIKSSQAADNFIRLAIKRTQTLLSDQSIAVFNEGGAFPELVVYSTIDNVTFVSGGESSADALEFKFKNPRYIAVAGGDNVKNPEFIYVKVYMLSMMEDVISDEGLDNVRNTYIKARAVMETPNQLSLTVNLKPYIRLYTQVSVGFNHTCAVAGNGEAYCWGANTYGQLGIGKADDDKYPIPQRVLLGHVFQWIAAGKEFTCGLATDTPQSDNGYRLYCWGLNDQGQLGSARGTLDAESEYKKTTPTEVNYASVAASTGISASSIRFRASKLVVGDVHACALGFNFGGTYCWGRKEFTGVTGGFDSDRVELPTLISAGEQPPAGYKDWHVCQISTSANHTCIAARTTSSGDCNSFTERATGAYYCWGHNNVGQLGNKSTTYSRTAEEVHTPNRYDDTTDESGCNAIFLNLDHRCNGQFVMPETKNWAQSQIMTFKNGTCAYFERNILNIAGLTLQRRLFCWGDADTATPDSSKPLITCNSFFCWDRYVHQMARDKDNRMWIVSRNAIDSDGLILGLIPRSDAATLRLYRYTTGLKKGEQLLTMPGLVQYPSFVNPLSMSANSMRADGHSCVIADDRRLYCWGENSSGQLGLGDVNSDGIFNSTDFADKEMPSDGVIPANQKVTILPRKLLFTH